MHEGVHVSSADNRLVTIDWKFEIFHLWHIMAALKHFQILEVFWILEFQIMDSQRAITFGN